MTVLEYCMEEVTRQGHNVREFMDGGRRVAWMMNGWAYAVQTNQHYKKPTIDDAFTLGRLVEPEINTSCPRTVNVWAGTRLCPDPEQIISLVDHLWSQIDILTPLQFYKGFEEVHPFVDGNGRAGKILLNWLGGTLFHPIFPPNNLWGQPIRNP